MLLRKFNLLLAAIVGLAAVIRLRGFDTHYLLASDTARDILTSKGAVLLHLLPWVGSFSSAGPFVFGPNWYWQLMFPQILFPNIFLGPWVMMLLISLLFVVVMGFCGLIFGGKRLGLITALFTAVSPAAVGLSAYPTQHAMIEIFSALTLLGFLAFLKTKKMVFAFLMSVSIGGAISYHYQAINLMPFYPVLLGMYFWKNGSIKDNLKLISVLILGSFIFLVPLLIWDFSRGFTNSLHVLGYFLYGQASFYSPNRWLTYLLSFWPTFIGKLIGGNFWIGSITALITILSLGYKLFRRKLSFSFFGLLIIFAIQFLIMRYFKGERYDGYLVYFHPIVLLLVAFAFSHLNKVALFILASVLLLVSIYQVMSMQDWNNDANKLDKIVKTVKIQFPNEKFSIFGRSQASFGLDYSLSLIFEKNGLGNDKGHPLGICLYEIVNCKAPGAVEIAKDVFQGQLFVLVDLEHAEKEKLTKQNNWYSFSTVAVYDDVQNWWRKGL